MLTQCTHCQAVFNVTAAQLEAKNGLVRCGGCLKVFNAESNLIKPTDAEHGYAQASHDGLPGMAANTSVVAQDDDDLVDAVENEPDVADVVYSEQANDNEVSGNSLTNDQLQPGFDTLTAEGEKSSDEISSLDEASEFVDEVVEALAEGEEDILQSSDQSGLRSKEEISEPTLYTDPQTTNDDYWEDEDNTSPILTVTENSSSKLMESESFTRSAPTESQTILPGEGRDFSEDTPVDHEHGIGRETATDTTYEANDFDEQEVYAINRSDNRMFDVPSDNGPEVFPAHEEPDLLPESGQYNLYDEELANNMPNDSRRVAQSEAVYPQADYDRFKRSHYDNQEPVYAPQTHELHTNQRHDSYYDEINQTPARKNQALKDEEEEEFDINKINWVVMHDRSPVKIVAGVIALLLILLIGLQVRYVFLDELAQIDFLRPVLDQLCVMTGCELPAKTDVKKIDLTHTKIESHPALFGALQISAELINRAEFAQPFPPLQFTLTDRLGHIVGRHSYPVEVYLANTTGRYRVNARLFKYNDAGSG